MQYSKQLAKVYEKQHLRSERKLYLTIADINVKLANIHTHIKQHIPLEQYHFATEYIHQYIAHTTVWNLKYVQNIENPEVVLMQILHLHYIFSHEPKDKFQAERQQYEELAEHYFNLGIYTQEHIEKRLEKMLDYIHTKENS